MESGRKSRSLRSTVIEPFKQIKLGVYVILISMVFVSLILGLVLNAFYEQYQHVMDIFNVVDPENKWELIQNPVIETNIVRIGIAIVGYFGCLLGTIFWLTHRYYGPLVSIVRFIKQLGDGDYSARVAVRKSDELLDLVSHLNSLAETLQERHGAGVNERRSERGRRSDD